MNYQKYWTGLAHVISTGAFEMPKNAIGMILRVVTFAQNYEEFHQKIEVQFEKIGCQLIELDDAYNIWNFLETQQLIEGHEIYKMLETAEKTKENVICGKFNYYTHNDS